MIYNRILKYGISTSNKNIVLCLKGDSKINLLRSQFFDSSEVFEKQAIEIANFIGDPLIYV